MKHFHNSLAILTVCACALASCASPDASDTSSASSSSVSEAKTGVGSAAVESTSSQPPSSVPPSSATPPKSIPSSIPALDVPFTSQAPFANWDDPYQEACEEAAMLMVIHYLNGTPLTPAIADKEILDLVAWETDNGYPYDVTAAQMVEIIEKKFGLNARVGTDVTIESIKEELAAGNPVVIPAAGRDLGNPYFSGEGPWYHALTIIGYESGWTGDTFIVNDPGTKRGQSYKYDANVLLNAIHDWTGVKEDIRNGKKAMVIIER